MRIAQLVLYSHDEQTRSIDFHDIGLNIITGESKTGKSALIHIVDYCLGSKTCHVPLGVIREKVSWYAIRLRTEHTSVFIARKNPDTGRQTSSEIMIQFEPGDTIPKFTDIAANANIDGLRDVLARLVGLKENLHVPPSEHTRPALEANFSHSKVFCFQDQSLIDNKNQLFFSQQDSFVAQSIRDTLPFFLGAVDENELVKQRELSILRRRLRQLERVRANFLGWKEAASERAQAFLSEARQVNLQSPDVRPAAPESVFEALQRISVRNLESYEFIDNDEELETLEKMRDSLREEYFSIVRRIEDALTLSAAKSEYGGELIEQRSRLSLFGEIDDQHIICPVCNTGFDDVSTFLVPYIDEMNEVSERISDLKMHTPRLQKYIADLQDRRDSLRGRVTASQQQINAVIAQTESLKSVRDLRSKQARVQGRISTFLENQKSDEDMAELDLEIDEVSRAIRSIESDVSGENFALRLRNAESNIEEMITEFTRDLELEHSSGRTRLDTRNLTVVSDTRTGPIKLEDMGSGDNWVGCHIAVHIALHRWFRSKDRPVPSFLILDQPSKAHYPPEHDGLSVATDDDRTAVRRLFRFLYESSEMPRPFQTIVIDHADENEDWFQESIVERWRDGVKLVPDGWPAL